MTDLRDTPPSLDRDALDAEIAGLDALGFPATGHVSFLRRSWKSSWPKLAALGFAIGGWYLVVWSGWQRKFVLPWPHTVWSRLWQDVANGKIPDAFAITMHRAVVGYAIACALGLVIGVSFSRWRVLRVALGSFITGLQTMPSIAWFPLAILLFQKSEGAITFVVVLGATPSIANGVINGSDQVPPLLLRAGNVLGARGLQLYRTVTMPASLPSILGGLKQGWAFAWRSLMAGELLVIVPRVFSVGARLQNARDLSDVPDLQANMIVILAIGIFVDALFFGSAQRFIRRRWGLVDPAA